MNFTVVWRQPALEQLAEIWLKAKDKPAISSASNSIDAMLQEDPASAGESREGDTRILISPPLAVYFDVLPDDRLVAVWAAWEIAKS